MKLREWLLFSVHSLCALCPIVWVGTLWALSARASAHIGHFPRPSLDDPKWIAPHDKVYHGMLNALWDTQEILLGATLLAMILMCVMFRRYNKRAQLAIVTLMFMAAGAFVCTFFFDVGSRMEWFID